VFDSPQLDFFYKELQSEAIRPRNDSELESLRFAAMNSLSYSLFARWYMLGAMLEQAAKLYGVDHPVTKALHASTAELTTKLAAGESH